MCILACSSFCSQISALKDEKTRIHIVHPRFFILQLTPHPSHHTPHTSHLTPPASHLTTPASQEETPASQEETPASQEDTPASQEETPASQEETPASQEETPASQGIGIAFHRELAVDSRPTQVSIKNHRHCDATQSDSCRGALLKLMRLCVCLDGRKAGSLLGLASRQRSSCQRSRGPRTI